MKKKNGFTLVELMAVIVLIALIMTIAIPNVLRLSNNTKVKAYNTKIDLIEAAGEAYGNDNIGAIKDSSGFCVLNISGNEVSSVDYYATNPGAGATSELFPCRRFTVDQLVEEGRIEWDDEHVCDKRDVCNSFQDNVVVNPVTNYIINKCFVYVYYRYNRVYAFFDKDSCDDKMTCEEGVKPCTPTVNTDVNNLGNSYEPAFGAK